MRQDAGPRDLALVEERRGWGSQKPLGVEGSQRNDQGCGVPPEVAIGKSRRFQGGLLRPSQGSLEAALAAPIETPDIPFGHKSESI